MKYWDDFQSKWGFGDGDAVPADAPLLRQVYVLRLNRLLGERGSTVRLLAWDRPGMHNAYLICSVQAETVRDVPEERLCRGQQDGGWEPAGDWSEPVPDAAYESVLADAQLMDLDDEVLTRVTLKGSQERPNRLRDTDDHVRHRRNRACSCAGVEQSMYVETDYYVDDIPNKCGRNRLYRNT